MAKSTLVKDIHNRLFKLNKNWLGVVCGGTGSGKSYSAIKLAEEIDPNFNIDQIVFSGEEFLEILTSKKLKRGSCIIWDEAGVGIPKREWYTISNKMINYVLQTFRYENLAVIFTVPTLKFIDSNSQKLFHCYIETMRIEHEKKKVISKVKRMIYFAQRDKTYYMFYRNGNSVITEHAFGLASKKILEDYEKKKSKWAFELKESALRDLRKHKEKRKSVKREDTQPGEMFEQLKEDPDLALKLSTTYRNKPTLKAELVRYHFSTTIKKSRVVKSLYDSWKQELERKK
jgi:hypothetical protein